jgi:hypothetical protein
MEHSSWEANSSSAGQEIPRVFWNSKIYCRVHKSRPNVPVVGQFNPTHGLLILACEDPFEFCTVIFLIFNHVNICI